MTLATATPGASRVPIADGTGKLALGWLPNNLLNTIEDSITAHAGGTQASAFALDGTKTAHHITVCATAADSVALPALVVGESHYIYNSGAAAAQVYGAGTSTINDVATATGVSLPAGTGALFYAASTGKWYTVGLTITATDATLSFTDITTNNASSSKHGFCPKLSNTSTQYLDGTGAWSTPAGSSFDPSAGAMLYEDWMGIFTASQYSWTTTLAGTGATVSSTADNNGAHPGQLAINKGTTTTGFASFYSIGTRMSFQKVSGAPLTYETAVLLDTISDGTNTYVIRVGITSDDFSNTTPANAIWFEYTHSTNSGAFTLNATGSSTKTTTNGTGATLASATWYRLKFVTASDWSSVTFYINGVSVGTVSSNLPAVNIGMGPAQSVRASAGTANRFNYSDYVFVSTSVTR